MLKNKQTHSLKLHKITQITNEFSKTTIDNTTHTQKQLHSILKMVQKELKERNIAYNNKQHKIRSKKIEKAIKQREEEGKEGSKIFYKKINNYI